MPMPFSIVRRHSLLAAAAVTLAFLLPATSPAVAQEKTMINAALTAEPQSLDPLIDTDIPALNVFYNVFDQIVGIDAAGKVAPRLASEWTASDDLKTWVFKIREGAKFHDGSAVTAEDVVFTFDTAMTNPASRLGGYLTVVDKVEATGPLEVTFTLKSSLAPFDRQVTLVPIVSKAAYEKLGAAQFAKTPVGSGPYSVESWNSGASITLKRFDDYWGPKGTFETVVFQPVPDETTRANSAQSGDLDVVLLGPASVPAVRASGAVNVVDQPANRILYVGFNSNAKWLDDPNIRKAVDYAIDRQALSARLLNGAVTPTAQLIAPATFGYDSSISATAYDPEKAKELVAASGYDGSPLTLTYASAGLPQIDQIAQAVGFFMNEAGLTVTFDPLEYNTIINNWFSNQLPGVYIMAYAPTILDADLPFTHLLKSGGPGYSFTPDIDKLIEAQVAEPNSEERAKLLSEISKKVNEATFYAPLFTDTYTYAVANGVKWTPRPDGLLVFN